MTAMNLLMILEKLVRISNPTQKITKSDGTSCLSQIVASTRNSFSHPRNDLKIEFGKPNADRLPTILPNSSAIQTSSLYSDSTHHAIPSS